MLSGAASLLLSLLIPVLHQFPQPQLHDEFSYLLAGETFASGRLTNPASPFAEHFETFQVLQSPTYMSKYPPGQGLALAAGIVLSGRPSVGVWLSSALAVVAVTWALQGMLPRRWALLGGLIAATHPLMQQWNKGYWGGSVALLGGALLVGSAVRLTRQARVRDGILAAIGVSVLANTRPYEGLLLTLLVSVATLIVLARRNALVHSLRSCAVPAAIVLALNFAWMAIYNHAITGDALRLPYIEYESRYALTPPVVLLPAPRQDKTYTHPVMETYYREWELPQYARQDTLAELPGAMWEKLRIAQRALLRAGNDAEELPAPVTALRWLIVLPWLGLPLVLWQHRRLRVVALLLALFLLGSFFALWFFPHYAAPAGVLLVLLHVGLVRFATISLPRRTGTTILGLVLLGHAVDAGSYLFRLGRGDFVPWTQGRSELLDDLRRDPDRWLVLVSHRPDAIAHIEWVFNGPDQRDGKVVFARSIDEPRDRALIADFTSRGYRVGRLRIDGAVLRWEEANRKRENSNLPGDG